MTKKITGIIPNTITLCNLLSGCVAIFMAFHLEEQFGSLSGLQWTWIAIAAAAMFDFCDGASARGLGAYSPLGKELDSLSDLVSFGVAPGLMMLNLGLQYSQHPWLCFSALLIPAFGALRLAKFNIDTTQSDSFRGLPIPANAIFWIGLSAWIDAHGFFGSAGLAVIIVLISTLMISNMPMFSLKFHNFDFRENFRRYAILAATVMFVIMWGVSGLLWTILLYIGISASLNRFKL
ncbi:MAG: CDP-diacylglycerol--serine O-phosphatidyltransferase [Muribaculaceae bacterium]|nr:CDP-diacylglycerol--serine O-phosphatidyltransferase [Muribaculaceae bacterium]